MLPKLFGFVLLFGSTYGMYSKNDINSETLFENIQTLV